MSRRSSLHLAVAETAVLLELAYDTYLTAYITRNLNRGSRVAARDLETLVDLIIPDALSEHEGVDGRVVWVLANLALHRRRQAVEEDALRNAAEAIGRVDVERAWRIFRLRLALSPAGLEWGGLIRYFARMRS